MLFVLYVLDKNVDIYLIAHNAFPEYISAQKISTIFDALNEREIAR
jgi:hypothetical protein